jgi:hypothetical protein
VTCPHRAQRPSVILNKPLGEVKNLSLSFSLSVWVSCLTGKLTQIGHSNHQAARCRHIAVEKR